MPKIKESPHLQAIESFYLNTNYESLYRLPVEQFFNQVMIRQRYISMVVNECTEDNKSTILPIFDDMLKGNIILDKARIEECTPPNITFIYPNPPRGVKNLTYENSVVISSNLLAFVDSKELPLIEETTGKDYSSFLPYSPKQEAMSKNIFAEGFKGKSYQEVIFEKSYQNAESTTDMFLEVDLRTPEDELVSEFKKLIRERRNTTNSIKPPTGKVSKVMQKCKDYRVVEAFDIEAISLIVFGSKISQKNMADILEQEMSDIWGSEDYRHKTKKYKEMIFEQSFYNQYLK